MKLTKGQIEYIKQRRKQVDEILATKPKYGFIAYSVERDVLNMFVTLHNIAMKEGN